MDTKFVTLWVIAIVAVSFMTVLMETSITGDVTNYRAASKLYGPALRRAMEQEARLSRVTPEQLDVQMYQGQIVGNKDKLVCGGSPDGPDPCMWFEDRQQWCCLPQSAIRQASFSPRAEYEYVRFDDRNW
ncbi:hypothetical protein C4580_04435 [Candidatus Woesearchaeota archaeon]|nr:MAG: hypothetical protein C4580_04435 [Candidatus Woesearchaeota archaeon]